MNLNKNVVALQRNLVIPPKDGMDNRIMVMTIQAHLMNWGYMLDEDAFAALGGADASWLESFHEDTITYLREVLGGKHSFTPLYKKFPQEVMSLSDSEIFWNAMLHYWSKGRWQPVTPPMERQVKFEQIRYTILSPGDQQAFSGIFTRLVSLNTSLTPTDMEVIRWFVQNEDLIFPNNIPFKENLCTLAGMGLDIPVNTTTDVLRIAVHMSGGDISLPAVPPAMVRSNRWSTAKTKNPKREGFKFRKFSRPQRRYILGLLEKTHCRADEMVLKDQRWIRLGEILHPGEYSRQFPKAYAAFQAIRNEKVQSWYGKVDHAFKEGRTQGIATLAQRPGEFMRKLDYLFRKYPNNPAEIMAYFRNVMHNTSNKVLFEVYEHFEKRYQAVKGRSIKIKGARKSTPLPDLPPLPGMVIELVHQAIFEALRTKFEELPALGNVWIDERLKNVPLPRNMRSMNFSTKPTVRGARIPFDNPDAKVIRPFIHWMDQHGNEDLDLSITFVGANHREVIAYTHLRSTFAVHSGDVRHRQGACAEYVDIDIQAALNSGFKYAIIDVRNFRGQALDKVECVFGIMERQYPESNKIWLPETISSTYSLKSDSSTTIIAMLDLQKKEYILIDMDSSSIPVAATSVNETLRIVEEYCQPPKVSVYDLLLMHTEARGRLVTTDSQVDTFFKFEEFINSYEKTASFMI